MNYEQMLHALKALGETSLKMREPGNWYLSQSGVEVSSGCMLESRYGNGKTPEEAVVDHWKRLTELGPREVIVLNATDYARRKAVVWNGFMWEERKEELREVV